MKLNYGEQIIRDELSKKLVMFPKASESSLHQFVSDLDDNQISLIDPSSFSGLTYLQTM